MSPLQRIRRPLRRNRSRGATAIEVAVVMPVFLVFVFALIEYGHMLWVDNMLNAAVRNAARFGSTEGATNADVELYVQNFMRGTVDESLIDIQIKDMSVLESGDDMPTSATDYSDLADVQLFDMESRELFVVRATVNFGDAAFLRFPGVDRIELVGQTIMRHE